jgi:formylglycine-generating enzyme required for sulfatase activity
MAAERFIIRLCLVFLLILSTFTTAIAEIRVFDVQVEEIVGRDQSQEQVEAFALQKAKRLAVEQAGTYISSLTIVRNYKLEKDEVTALASGVVQAKIVGVPSVRVKNGVVHIRVKSKIKVDTSILERQIQEIMKEKGALKKLEEERRRVKELEEKLASLKSSELKRLEELNAQALALERERERQRLFREEQALKARGELSKAEAERLAREREMQERINRTLAEQEKAKRAEAEALAKEQDRIRRAQLENERRWNELARKAQLSQASWVPIDDSLSLKQAMEEAKALKGEIANLKNRLDLQFEDNKRNLRKAYAQQVALMKPKLPPSPAEKDAFEKTAEYNKRIADYKARVKKAKRENKKAVEKLNAEKNFTIAQSEVHYFEQKNRLLEPFVKRLQTLQDRKFHLPEETMTVKLGEPEADHDRFPLYLQYGTQRWTDYWKYTNRNQARDFYKTRTFLKAEGLFQMEEKGSGIGYRLTAARVSHPGTGDVRDFRLKQPQTFSEITGFKKGQTEALLAKEKGKKAAFLYKLGLSSSRYKDPVTGMEFIFIRGDCFQMGSNDGDSDERPVHKVCVRHFFMGKYEVTQGQWKRVMGNNPSRFKKCGDDCPVEQVSWKDAQKFIRKLNQMEGTDKYRLPSEAEWEYACRAGSTTRFSFGDNESSLSEYAWYSNNSGQRTHPVGQKRPNAWGLYDMHGNVWEWCQDWFGNYPYGDVNNPIGPSSGSGRVLRGGSWGYGVKGLRSAFRLRVAPDGSEYDLGFRVVRAF